MSFAPDAAIAQIWRCPAKARPLERITSAELVAGRGLVGDHRFSLATKPMNQVTLIEAEALAAATALLRGARLWPLGTLGAVGLQGQIDGQWTLCEDDVGRIEPDTARPIIRRQWWPHTGASLGVVFAWR